jgi:hypothetical protein
VQVELVGDARRQKVLVVAQHGGVVAHLIAAGELFEEAASLVRGQVAHEVGVHAAAGKDAYGLANVIGRVAGAFQHLPCALQKDAVLRVHLRGFFGIDAEELGVEHVGLVEQRPRGDVAFVLFGDGAFAGLQFGAVERR